jgi:hypothetical protein
MTCRLIQGVKGPVRKIVEDWLPPMASVEIFEFDRDGNQISGLAACATQPSDIRIHGDGSRTEAQAVSGSDFWTMAALNGAGFPTRGADAAETTFAADGAPIETFFRTKDGAEIARIRYAHDEKQRISEAVRLTTVPLALPAWMRALARMTAPSKLGPLADELDPNVTLRVTFKYDDDGRVLEQSQFYDSRLSERITYVYNDHGDRVAVTHSGRGCNGPQHFTYEYEYDAWGNWIRQIARPPSGDIAECRREISYYE